MIDSVRAPRHNCRQHKCEVSVNDLQQFVTEREQCANTGHYTRAVLMGLRFLCWFEHQRIYRAHTLSP